MSGGKTRWARLAILGFGAGLFGCDQPTAHVSEPVTYAQHGIDFKHPKNWTVQAQALSPEITYLTVDTGGSATLIVTVQPAQDAPGLLAYANDISKGTALQTPSLIQKQSSNIVLDPSNKNRAMQSFSMNVLGVEVPHQVEYRLILSPQNKNQRVAFLMWQTAVDDASKTQQGASLVFDSFNFAQ